DALGLSVRGAGLDPVAARRLVFGVGASGERLTEAQRTPLLESLAGRWTAFHRRAGVMWGTPVYHDPWELYAASAVGDLTAPLRWAGLPDPESEPVVHASYGVHARLGLPRPA